MVFLGGVEGEMGLDESLTESGWPDAENVGRGLKLERVGWGARTSLVSFKTSLIRSSAFLNISFSFLSRVRRS